MFTTWKTFKACWNVNEVLSIHVFSQIIAVKEAVDIPVLIGSGVTADNLHKYEAADAIIIGSHFKEDGK